MNFYPKGYFNKVSEISLDYLKENNIAGLILDVDNTLIDYYKNMADETLKWSNNLKENGIKMYILSNSNKKDKVSEVAQKLGIEYSYFGMKPLKFGFKKAKKNLNLKSENIGVVGDQIFTDVIGANRMKMFPILVEPIKEKDIWITLIKRPIENYIKSRFKRQRANQNKKHISNDNLKQYKVSNKNTKNCCCTKNNANNRETKEERDVF
jgi:uncharacterized protein